ncbi:nitroreductase [Candidatus Heimdallarchaeota archaeon B3_Heim]|nr:MAG: nitroreductase [Candidatus Heimdallarchaeota archaeon B3_Heim]
MLDSLIRSRRAFRALQPVEISPEEVKNIAELVSLSPSCMNNQPWRYIFVQDPDTLQTLFTALSRGNAWAKNASMIVAVHSEASLDCQISERDPYFLFDTGMATAYLILLLTEMGLVAHPIAGYDLEKSKEILKIPKDKSLITLIVVGKHTSVFPEEMSEKQRASEPQRPKRKSVEEFISFNQYSE